MLVRLYWWCFEMRGNIIYIVTILGTILYSQLNFAQNLYINFNDEKIEVNHPNQEFSIVRKTQVGETLLIGDHKTRLTETVLKSKMAQVADKTIQKVFISGHHSHLNFAGKVGEIRSDQLSKILLANELHHFRNGVEVLYLFGCYTVTPYTVSFWAKVFPNVRLILGYGDRSPYNYTRVNATVIEKIFDAELDLLQGQMSSAKNLMTILGKSGVSLSIALKVDSLYKILSLENGKLLTQDLEATIKTCSSQKTIDKINSLKEIFTCYLNANEDCRDVPQSTSSSVLRTAYSQFTRLNHCVEDDSTLLAGEEIIRMIYFHQILKHYRKFFKDELLRVSEIIKSLSPKTGEQESLFLFNSNSRGEWLDGIEVLMSKYALPNLIIEDRVKLNQLKFLEIFFRNSDFYLYRPSPFCVPLSWVDTVTNDKPACGFDISKMSYR